jgi:transcriptional regulator with XRE-family HTH domain
MVTSIPRKAAPRLFIREHVEACKLPVEEVAKRVGISRTTLWRWNDEPKRLDILKMAKLARVLGIEPAEFFFPPGRRSIDAILSNASEDAYEATLELAQRLARKSIWGSRS